MQKSITHWQQGTSMEMLLWDGHFINFKEKVKVIYVGKSKCGGNGEIPGGCTIPKY